MLKKLMERLKRIQHVEWIILLIVLGAMLTLGLGGLEGKSPSSASDTEKRVAQVLSAIEGAGKVEVAIYYNTQEEEQDAWGAKTVKAYPVGVVIVAEGAGSMYVRLELLRAVQVMLGLSPDSVEIFQMQQNKP